MEPYNRYFRPRFEVWPVLDSLTSQYERSFSLSVTGNLARYREARAENSVGAEALGRNVGEAFEEFVKFTEELKHRGSGGEELVADFEFCRHCNTYQGPWPTLCMSTDVQETLQLEPPAPQQPSRPDQFLQSGQNHLPSDTFFGRLFGRQRLRKSGENLSHQLKQFLVDALALDLYCSACAAISHKLVQG